MAIKLMPLPQKNLKMGAIKYVKIWWGICSKMRPATSAWKLLRGGTPCDFDIEVKIEGDPFCDNYSPSPSIYKATSSIMHTIFVVAAAQQALLCVCDLFLLPKL